MGYSYCGIIGKLIYPYIIGRLDMGFATAFLSRFSAAPHEEHYRAVKRACRFLRATKHWGIIYWRPAPLMDLPDVPIKILPVEDGLHKYPVVDPFQLYGILVDASYPMCVKTRRSLTGLVISLAGSAVLYKAIRPRIVALSSTESELILSL